MSIYYVHILSQFILSFVNECDINYVLHFVGFYRFLFV